VLCHLAVIGIGVRQEDILLVLAQLVLGSCSTLRTDGIHVDSVETLSLELLLQLLLLLALPKALELLVLLLLLEPVEASTSRLHMLHVLLLSHACLLRCRPLEVCRVSNALRVLIRVPTRLVARAVG